MAEDKPKRKDKNEEVRSSYGFTAGSGGPMGIVYTSPIWLIIMILGWVFILFQMSANPDYFNAFEQLYPGIPLTLWLAGASYFFAIIIGLIFGLIRAYPPKEPETKLPPDKQTLSLFRLGVYHVVTVYVEFMRGIPPLVFLLIAGFVVVPAIREPFQIVVNSTIIPLIRSLNPEVGEFVWRGRDPITGIVGLSMVYGAFLSEVFRSGIQSIPKGQTEAAKSLGMTFLQTMRYVVIPQAIRRILPELGNNLISMIKDTSLVTILGTSEITQLARRWSGSQFTYVETYSVLAIMYLTMTVPGSLFVQWIERRLGSHNER